MDKSKSIDLEECVKALYFRSGQLKLYVSMSYNKDYPDIKRLKSETEKVKKIILQMESEINKL